MQLQFVNNLSFFLCLILLKDVNVTVFSFHKSKQGSQAASLHSSVALQPTLDGEVRHVQLKNTLFTCTSPEL